MKNIFFWMLPACLLACCTAATPAKKRTAECYVRYLAPEANLLTEISLKEGPADGALQAVQVPGGVLYQHFAMRLLPTEKMTYQYSQPGGYTPEHIFRWKDTDHQPHELRAALAPISGFRFNMATLSHRNAATLTWAGAALEKGEGLVFMWENPVQQLTVPMEVTGMPGQSSIEFPAAKLAELAPGEWTLYLVRKKVFRTEVDGVSMSGLLEYYTHTDTIKVSG